MKRKTTAKSNTEQLKQTVIEAALEKKAKEIVAIDLSKLNESVADYFVVCHGDSGTQVRAIAESVLKEVKEKLQVHPNYKEGIRNLEWVVIDYIDVVVHIFLRDKRAFYNIEDLWSDAEQINFSESDFLKESNKKLYGKRTTGKKTSTKKASKK